MTMDSTFATLACYLLALSFAVAQTQKVNLAITPTVTTPGLKLTHTTTTVSSSRSTEHVTVISNVTENTTGDNETFTETTAATNESTSHPLTSQSTTLTTPLTNSTSLTTTTPGTPTFTTLTTPTMQTTASNISTPDTTVVTTANSSVNTSDSTDRTTQGLGLNASETHMTIVFSVALGVFALVFVVFLCHRYKHKIQYLHQPLNNTGDTGEFEADDDTLVISGGLYDGHPIYDNLPTAPADQSQFRLQFLH